jgi:hypothetical protein
MKIYITLLVTLFLVAFSISNAHAQNDDDTPLPVNQLRRYSEAGFSGSFFGRGVQAFNVWGSTGVWKPVGKRWIADANIGLSNTRWMNAGNGEQMNRDFNTQQLWLSARMSYIASDRLLLGGKAYASVVQSPWNGGMDVVKGVLFNASYKVSEHFSIHGAVNISNGANQWQNQWMMPGGMGMPAFRAVPMGTAHPIHHQSRW